MVSRYLQLTCRILFQMLPYLTGKYIKLLCILCIGTSGSILMQDGMLGNSRDRGTAHKAAFLCTFLHLQQSILIGTIAIAAYQNSRSMISLYDTQSLQCCLWCSSSIGRHSYDAGIILFKIRKTFCYLWITKVDTDTLFFLPFTLQYFSNAPCSAAG